MTTGINDTGKRQGLILRVLPHGTIIVWDKQNKRSYPYYKAGTQKFSAMEDVLFQTDETDTVVVSVDRSSPPKKPKERASRQASTASQSAPKDGEHAIA